MTGVLCLPQTTPARDVSAAQENFATSSAKLCGASSAGRVACECVFNKQGSSDDRLQESRLAPGQTKSSSLGEQRRQRAGDGRGRAFQVIQAQAFVGGVATGLASVRGPAP